MIATRILYLAGRSIGSRGKSRIHQMTRLCGRQSQSVTPRKHLPEEDMHLSGRQD